MYKVQIFAEFAYESSTHKNFCWEIEILTFSHITSAVGSLENNSNSVHVKKDLLAANMSTLNGNMRRNL